ncbi:cadherin-related family member 5-like, partial [Amblyraja radiata]|uniref:cadherin-related family member 5-like n=1 Tax=Amblyraja radiata TaxID=386614 RepID=UPI001402D8E2
CCVPVQEIHVQENNQVGVVISSITVKRLPVTVKEPDVAAILTVNGTSLCLQKSLDFEAMKDPVIIFTLQCGPDKSSLSLYIVVDNINDNRPTFPETALTLNISELYPVGKLWTNVTAVDLDEDVIYYSLDPNTDGATYFQLKTENTPDLSLKRALDYEVKRSLTLVLNAKEAANSRQVNNSVTITVRVLDQDNRPPLFEPCAGSVGPGLCLNAAYTGVIRQHTIELSPLTLGPRNILAVDGDSGINATILYRIINGDDDHAFQIDERDGALNITKAVTSLRPITLTILAYQENDRYKSTTTTVTLTVDPFSNHALAFQKTVYYGTIQRNSPPGSIVLERGSSTRPLVVLAQDKDYPNTTNPAVTYSLSLGDIFTISRDGLIFTRSLLPPAQHEHVLTVTAEDEENRDVAQTEVRVLISDTDVPSTVTASSGGAVATTAPGTRPSTGTGTATAPVIPTRTPTPSQATPGTPGSVSVPPPGSGPTPTDPPTRRTTPPHTGSPGTGTSLTEIPGSGATAPATPTRTPAPPGQPTPSQTTPGTPGSASELPPGSRPTPTDTSARRTPPHTRSPGTGTSLTGNPGSGATAPATAPTKPTRPPEPPGHSTQAPLPDISSTLPGTGAT